jgi:prepilin signal peptidase PulO-like enzyme (type II secretory pathway)
MFSTWWLAVIFTLAGAAVGSFLNVCIARIPEGLSIPLSAMRPSDPLLR